LFVQTILWQGDWQLVALCLFAYSHLFEFWTIFIIVFCILCSFLFYLVFVFCLLYCELNSYNKTLGYAFLYIQVHSYLHSYSCPCTSSLMAADERFHGKESGYQLEETARSSQENMDLSDSRWYWNVTARLLGCLHSSWPWKRDATVSEDYALLMMMTVTSAKDSMSCLAFVWLLSVCLSIYRRSIFEQWSHHVNTVSLLTYL